MHAAPALFRLLGDEVRLRLLRLLSQERLNVTELTGILGMAQSGVSRHLGLLKDAGLDCRGARGRLHLLPHRRRRSATARTASGRCGRCSRRSSTRIGATAEGRADDARLEEVRRRAEGELRRACGSGYERAAARAGAELGGVGARARPPAAAAARRRSRLRRGLPDRRDQPLGLARHRRRPVARGA